MFWEFTFFSLIFSAVEKLENKTKPGQNGLGNFLVYCIRKGVLLNVLKILKNSSALCPLFKCFLRSGLPPPSPSNFFVKLWATYSNALKFYTDYKNLFYLKYWHFCQTGDFWGPKFEKLMISKRHDHWPVENGESTAK